MSLAIILPIYKPDFLREALQSLANQTSHDFMAYICDDCSPHALQPIVREFEGRFPFRYIRFDTNLGGQDLVGQWERCLLQTQGEEWLWLFSDDDQIDAHCVEAFHQARSEYPLQPLFHFDTTVIDSAGHPTTDPHFIKADFPTQLSAEDFLRGRLSYRYNSFIVEYIFRRDLFERQGGFVRYDMAWCSDDASWFQLARPAGILTIKGPRVFWRKSEANITPDHSRRTARRKLYATYHFLRFCSKVLPGSFCLRAIYFLHAIYNALPH